MELYPGLALGFLNGWVLLVVFYAVFAILLILFPREVVQRLYDRSDWSEQQKVLSALGKIFIFAWILLVVFTPLSFGTWNFILGLILFVAGLTGMVRALLDYRYTPLHEPVTQGIYRCSRNPQQVMILLAFLGISFATGSWLAVATLTAGAAAAHTRVLAEEHACQVQYGDAYLAYMERVPRYFLYL
jgi:protein-S-isoprenylcysteine O-methyltransferase Ste14